jgi:hypothetical protein
VRCFAVDPHLGDRDQLAALRARLAARGIQLVLDFVPNHVASDHTWLETDPGVFIRGTTDDLAAQPADFFEGPAGRIFAHGRDPYFPAWNDTAQLHAFSPLLRARARAVLLDIADQCDGVRCDMAMLMTNQIFAQTWGTRAGDPPATEYWVDLIGTVKARYPAFQFLAEVYWDLEWELQQQGFDYTYDKRLYDRLVNESARSVLGHLSAPPDYRSHMLHFVENHDEARAITVFGPGRDLAAAVVTTTLPGATLLHMGQLTGRQIKVPVQLGRGPVEEDNASVTAFYRLLLAEVSHPVYHEGTWRLCECRPAWDLNASHRSLVAYGWRQDDTRRLVVVNYSASASQGRVLVEWLELAGRPWELTDRLHPGTVYERDGDAMRREGLYIDLLPWQAHIFEFQPGAVEEDQADPAQPEADSGG